MEQRQMGLERRGFYTAFDQIHELTELRAELPWLADVPRNVCAQLLVELDKAWQRCFKKLAGAPRFKHKGPDVLGLCEPHPKVWRLQGSTVRLPELGDLRMVLHRPLEGTPKTCRQIEMAEPSPRTQPVVALDRGVVQLGADSDGNPFESPRFYARSMRPVVVETLQIRDMVRAQRALARGILDAGWGLRVEFLRYKLAWSGGQLLEVPAHYSSQACHRCDAVDAASRRTQAEFVGTHCGLQMHADLNAELVLKSRANRSALPVEGSVLRAPRRSRKRLAVPGRPAESFAL